MDGSVCLEASLCAIEGAIAGLAAVESRRGNQQAAATGGDVEIAGADCGERSSGATETLISPKAVPLMRASLARTPCGKRFNNEVRGLLRLRHGLHPHALAPFHHASACPASYWAMAEISISGRD
jgi:hypothetical protein